jgi:multimeric flavodoxin WrbA
MKVILVNGSPHQNGCTYTALSEVADTLNQEGIETFLFWIGIKPINGCLACETCATKKRCVIEDKVNEFLNIASEYDGFVFGSPVHFAAAGGALTSFMDRVFYADYNGEMHSFYLKPATCVVSAGRSGTTAAYDQLNKYFGIMQMPIISSQYWNMVHGATPAQVKKDLEGLQIMRTLGRNLAFFLKCKEAGLQQGVTLPKSEKTIYTSFIR